MDTRPIEILGIEEFHDRLARCLKTAVVTEETRAFESRLESAVRERLEGNGEDGWDFEVVNEFFEGSGGHGLSILIQNMAMPWKTIGDWLMAQTAGMPMGVVVNYELRDSIDNEVMGFGAPLLRRVITRSEIFEERS